MPQLPTFQSLYDEARAEVQADDRTDLTDFQAGSFLDAIAGVSATVGRGIMRWVSRQMRRAFLSTAGDGQLEFKAVDLFGEDLVRRDGESFGEYRERVETHRDTIFRGTEDAVAFKAERIEGVTSVTTTEQPESGITQVTATYDPNQTDADTVREAFFDEIEAWKSAGGEPSLEVAEA